MSNNSLTFLSRLYVDHLKVMNYADRTVGHRETTLTQFSAWCEERGILKASEVTKPILERYRRHLHHSRDKRGNPFSAKNQMARLIPIRGFFKWATRQNYLLYNPASELELPKVEKRLPKATLSPEEAELILSLPNIHTDEGLRDRAIVEVLYSTGIRRMEVVNLTRADLHPDRGVLAVRQGKGKKDRFVPISDRAMGWLKRYLDEVRIGFAIEPDPENVFLESTGQPLTPDKLSRLVSKYIKQADIGKGGSCHLFRHTVATLMLDNGADIRFIQQMLGHVSIGTTEIYTHVSIVKLKQIHDMTHPTMHKKHESDDEPEATEEELLATLESEDDD
ncbi:site-specific tyrosine recombinase XerC [Marinimicrobium locisalis]|uniref:site-specific tyrosine recombinase XerC n=1 Tax=Marinimicrobium locisalis TaxID=546022 RepID=UPI0032218E88